MPIRCTLLELVHQLTQFFGEEEVVTLVMALVNSGRISLIGNFAGVIFAPAVE